MRGEGVGGKEETDKESNKETVREHEREKLKKSQGKSLPLKELHRRTKDS